MPSSAGRGADRGLRSFPTRRSSDLRRAAHAAIGCSAATAQNVAPSRVSARVVNTHSNFFSPSSAYGNARRTPSERPIQFFCITRTRDRKSTRLNSSHSQISYAVFCWTWRRPRPPLFPYTTLFRSAPGRPRGNRVLGGDRAERRAEQGIGACREHPQQFLLAFERVRKREAHALRASDPVFLHHAHARSEEHTSELQSQSNLVCRLLLDVAPTAASALSLHDALPICAGPPTRQSGARRRPRRTSRRAGYRRVS